MQGMAEIEAVISFCSARRPIPRFMCGNNNTRSWFRPDGCVEHRPVLAPPNLKRPITARAYEPCEPPVKKPCKSAWSDQPQAASKVKSQLFADEACTILTRKGTDGIKDRKPHALVIGAMAGTHAVLVARGLEVTATDMSPDVAGRSLGGVTVRNGCENEKLMEASDIVIATGMTFPNGTLPDLMRAAQNSNTSTMIWAVTGRNLGHYYTAHGVDCVISDPAPFLQLPGPVKIGIWRRKT